MEGECMSLLKKIIKPIEYEIWIKVSCPRCYMNNNKKKHLFVTLPARGLPDKVKCFDCDYRIPTKDLFKKGKEIIGRAEKDEKIKGITI